MFFSQKKGDFFSNSFINPSTSPPLHLYMDCLGSPASVKDELSVDKEFSKSGFKFSHCSLDVS